MKSGIRISIRVLCFLLIFLLLFCIIERILVAKTFPLRDNLNEKISPYILSQKLSGFYELEEDSLDVVFMGSSHIHCCVDPLIIWENYGYTSYDLSADSQDMATAYYYCKEMFKTQSPQKVVVTIDQIPERQTGLETHFSFDFMEPSLNKLEGLIRRAPDDQWPLYLTSYPDYHSRWTELTIDDFRYFTAPRENPFFGYFAYCVTETIKPWENEHITTACQLTDGYKNTIDRFYALCQENDCTLEFIKTPSAIGSLYTELVNAVRAYVSDRGIKVTDYSYDDRIGIDWSRDFADQVHANIYGSEKFSKVLGEDLLDGLTVKEHSESVVESYNEGLAFYRQCVAEYEQSKTSGAG